MIQTPNEWAYRTLGDQNYRHHSSLWAKLAIPWSRLTTPSDPPAGATFEERDTTRRGRIASAEAFLLLCTVILAGLIGIFGPNKQILVIVGPVLLCTVLACVANRFGFVDIAGWLIYGGLVGSMAYSMFNAPGGLSVLDSQILFLTFFADLFFVAILPLRFFFVPGLVNLAISLYVLSFAHHQPSLDILLTYGYFPTFARLMQIHITATGVPAILVLIMRELIRRANNAEATAALQRALQQQANGQLQQKQELEADIGQIVAVHTAVANKQLQARVQLSQIRHLVMVASALNNLLGRYERLKQEAEAMERLLDQLPVLMQSIEATAHSQSVFHMDETSTMLDPIIRQLNGKRLSHSRTSHPHSIRSLCIYDTNA